MHSPARRQIWSTLQAWRNKTTSRLRVSSSLSNMQVILLLFAPMPPLFLPSNYFSYIACWTQISFPLYCNYTKTHQRFNNVLNTIWWHEDKNFVYNHCSTPDHQHNRRTMHHLKMSFMKTKFFLRYKLCHMNWKLVIWSFYCHPEHNMKDEFLRFFASWKHRGTRVICSSLTNSSITATRTLLKRLKDTSCHLILTCTLSAAI